MDRQNSILLSHSLADVEAADDNEAAGVTVDSVNYADTDRYVILIGLYVILILLV